MSHIALEKFERGQMRSDQVPQFRAGDTVRVNFRVREGDRERIQAFEGVCTRRNGGGVGETVTVRKISSGIGVERTFFLHSPLVESIALKRRGHVRRARLYYLRDRFGKKARVKGSKKFLTEKQMEAMVSGEEIPEPTPEEIEELETAAGEDLEEEAVASEASSEPAEEKEEAKKED
jgi:large subunit ribosomal protein L19